ncbi:MAG: DUF3383 domain-containing protein [Candidatus Korarchaeota archaeon]|nr:DUF3383 domain-containing protein [Candidatus Korarchaeota archaeon]
MSDIEQIVDVQISRETTAVTQAGFGVMMFLGLHKRFNERAVEYTSLADMVTAGFETTDKEYLAASAYFAQSPAPEKIIIGRQAAADVQTITYTAASGAGETYTVTIDDGDGSETFTHVTDGAETAAQVAAAMELLINGSGTLAVTHDDTAADGTATLTPDVAGAPYTLKLTSNISVVLATTESLTDALNAVVQANSDFYGISAYTHLEADILEIDTFANAGKYIYGYSTSNATDKTTATTAIIGQLQTLTRDRTFGVWDEEAGVGNSDATEYPEAAWMGDRFPSDPGSSTWMFKTLSGITVDSLTSTESTNIRNKNGNTYETIGGVNITREGKVASGEYIDVIRGIDWLESRMEERIYSRLVNLPKIPYTNAGIAIIESEIRAQLQEAVESGVIDGEQDITITTPKISEISSTDRANRVLPAITFEAKLAGAIHKTTIKGVVTV